MIEDGTHDGRQDDHRPHLRGPALGVSAGPGDEEPLPLEVEDLLMWLSAERGRARNTIEAYRRDLRTYVAWLRGRGLTLEAVTEADLVDYVGDLRERGLAPASVARALVPVRSLHRFLMAEERLPTDPGAHLEVPRVPRGLPKALTEAGGVPPARRAGGRRPGGAPRPSDARGPLRHRRARVGAGRAVPRRHRSRCGPPPCLRQGQQRADRPDRCPRGPRRGGLAGARRTAATRP